MRKPLRRGGSEAIFSFDSPTSEAAHSTTFDLAQPVRFEHAQINLASLSSQIRGRSKLMFHYVAAMTRANARRPLARQSDGSLILLDGRRRGRLVVLTGYDRSAAWIWPPDVEIQPLSFEALAGAR